MKSVLVVGADNMVALRTIQPGETVGDMLIVLDGVKPGDRVIVDGIQKARPGSKVNPTVAPAGGTADANRRTRRPRARHPGPQPAAQGGGKVGHGQLLHPPARSSRSSSRSLTVMLGLVTISGLSVEQYPFLAPPNIRVTATYPGASAEAVEQSVATPIEQEVNGVDRLIYMKSSNTSDGRMLLDVNFEVGTDQDTANVLTQNRVSAAQARLPVEVTQQGVTVKKQSPSILMLISIYSPADAYDANFLINYAGINLRDQLLRIPGIAQVDLFGGTDYGMRIWFRPDRLAKLGLTPADVINAIKEQNLQAPTGKVGAAPTPKDQQFTNTVSAPGRLVTPEEFENIIVRQSDTGAVVRIKDIGRAELGSQDYNAFGRLNGKPAGALAVYLLPGANQLKAAEIDLRDDGTGEGACSRPAWTTRSSTTPRRPWRRRSKASCIPSSRR